MKKIILTLLFVLLLVGCTQTPTVEIREYEGKRLNSVDDFRENSIKGPQYINATDYNLKITGLINEPKEYTYQQITSLPNHKKITTLYCVEGWDVKLLWEGVKLSDVFKDINISPEANTVIFYAYDGYTTSFPLSHILDNDLILAYKQNDEKLLPKNGFPFQLVAESKWGYKWIKWITKIEFSEDENYRGFWENRGWNQNGSLEGSKFARDEE